MSGKSTGARSQNSGARSQNSGARSVGSTTVTTTTTFEYDAAPPGCFWGCRARWRGWRVHRVERKIEKFDEEVQESQAELHELQGKLGAKKRNQLAISVANTSDGQVQHLDRKDRKKARQNAKAGVSLDLGLGVRA